MNASFVTNLHQFSFILILKNKKVSDKMGRAAACPSPVGRTSTQILSGTMKMDQDRPFSLRRPAGDALTSKLVAERKHMGRRLAFFRNGDIS
jgi:hypothetical protein